MIAATLEKYSPSSSAYRRLSRMEAITRVHLLAMLGLSSWYFGGESAGAERGLLVGGAAGALLLGANLWARAQAKRAAGPLWWLLPALLLNILVAASCANPSFTERVYEGVTVLARTGARHPGWPSTIFAPDTWHRLLIFDACYITAFNIVLVFRRRRSVRFLLAAIIANASLLAVFGTLQKFGSDGIFFGAVPSPNTRFFATFIYGNHWAAYAVLAFSAGTAWVLYARECQAATGNRQSAEPLLFVALLSIALTPFVIGSRSGMALLGTGVVILATILWRHSQAENTVRLARNSMILIALLVALGAGALEFGHSALRERWLDTEEQWRDHPLSGREKLYRETWQLFAQRPLFGWGLGSFGKAYLAEHPRPLAPNRQYERTYANAHSDWLEVLADLGIVGAGLLVAMILVPIFSAGILRHPDGLTAALGAGCSAIVLYASVEFPFENPAVALLWWVCFFSALQSGRLNRKHAERAEFSSY